MKRQYAQEGFDLETRLYAFKDDQMVGFITIKIFLDKEDGIKKANLTPPKVLPEHDEVVSEILFNKAKKVLKNKGVKKIYTQFGVRQSKNEKDAIAWGFKFVANEYYLFSIDLTNLDSDITTDNVVPYNYDKHSEDCAKIVAAETGQDIEHTKRNFLSWKDNPDPRRMTIIVEEKGKVKAYTRFYKNNVVKKYANNSGFWAENEDYMKQLLAKIAQVVKENNIERLTAAFGKEEDAKHEKYKPIKFDFISVAAKFEMDI
ncbi:MAG: hypothetical protein ACTSQX_00785 [Candidatus Heimdallarchaeota archaeon]